MKKPIKPPVVSVERFVPLTMSLADKIQKANDNMGVYTILVNRKHTLAHVVIKGEDMYMRVPIKAKKLMRESDQTVEAYFMVRLHGYLMQF